MPRVAKGRTGRGMADPALDGTPKERVSVWVTPAQRRTFLEMLDRVTPGLPMSTALTYCWDDVVAAVARRYAMEWAAELEVAERAPGIAPADGPTAPYL